CHRFSGPECHQDCVSRKHAGAPPLVEPANDGEPRTTQSTGARSCPSRPERQTRSERQKGKVRDLLIFDLDGTLIDSKEDLVNSVNAMLAWKHRDPLPHDVVASYIGNGAPMLVKRALPGLNEDDHLAALQFFLDYYREHMLDATVLYPGVREALDRLHREGVPLAVLTNKPVRFSVQLIAGLGLAGHFFQIYGG